MALILTTQLPFIPWETSGNQSVDNICEANSFVFICWTQLVQFYLMYISKLDSTKSKEHDTSVCFCQREGATAWVQFVSSYFFPSLLPTDSFSARFQWDMRKSFDCHKLCISISFCLLYVPIRYSIPISLVIAHLKIMSVISIKMCSWLMSMGSVQKESLNFEESWIQTLGDDYINSRDGIQKLLKLAHFIMYRLLLYSVSLFMKFFQ